VGLIVIIIAFAVILSPFPLSIPSPTTLGPTSPVSSFPVEDHWVRLPPSIIMGVRRRNLRLARGSAKSVCLRAHHYLHHKPPRPHTRPRALTTPLYATTLHTSLHKLSLFTCLPKNIPLRAVLATLMESNVRSKFFTLEFESPRALAKYTQEPWLYPSLPLTKERSSVGHAQAPHRLASRWCPFSIHSSNSLGHIVSVYV